MKKLFIVTIVMLCATVIFAQNRSRFHHNIDSVTFRSGGSFPIIYKIGTAVQPPIDLCSESLYGIVTLDAKTGKLSFDFWSYPPSSGTTGCINQTTQLGTFEVDLSRATLGNPTRVLSIPFRAWAFSVGTVPFKYRLKSGDTPATVSSVLGVTVSYGRTWGTSVFTHRAAIHRSITIGPLFGLSSADIKKETSKDPATWDAANNRTNLAMMYGVNAAIARNNLGLVFSFGFDNALGPRSGDWAFQNKPWFGIGINTNLGLF